MEKIKIVSIDEQNGTIVLTGNVNDGYRKRVTVNDKTYRPRFYGGQCWLYTGKKLGETYSIKL
jgi:hypothetical protein